MIKRTNGIFSNKIKTTPPELVPDWLRSYVFFLSPGGSFFYLLTLFFLWSLFISVMSMQEEVALSGDTVEDKADDPQAIFKLAVKEVRQCLR